MDEQISKLSEPLILALIEFERDVIKAELYAENLKGCQGAKKAKSKARGMRHERQLAFQSSGDRLSSSSDLHGES